MLESKINELDYFPEDYEESRDMLYSFLEEASRKPTEVLRHVVCEDKTVRNGELTIDTAIFDALGEKDTLLMLVSTTHGIESVGAPIQFMFLNEILERINVNTGIALVHSLNPYGYHHGRRVNENNVDLNRAFVTDLKNLDNKNPEVDHCVELVDKWLAPEGKRRSALYEGFRFTWEALKVFGHVPNFSYRLMKTAVVGGQYKNPKRIYYGGNSEQEKLESSVLHFKEIMEKVTEGYKDVIIYDLHSGLGRRYSFIPMMDYVLEEKRMKKLRAVFPDLAEIAPLKDSDFRLRKRSIWDKMRSCKNLAKDIVQNVRLQEQQDPFKSNNSLEVYAKEYSKSANEPYCLTIDYGVDNVLKTIYSLIAENQVHHYGANSQKSEEEVKRMFKERFHPSEEKWRINAIELARNFLDKTCVEFGLYRKKVNIDLLEEAVRSSWNVLTCVRDFQNEWNPEDTSYGQGLVTAMVCKDYLGGKIAYDEKANHYWNVLENGTIMDFTGAMGKKGSSYSCTKLFTKEELLRGVEDQSPHIIQQQYKDLTKQVEEYIHQKKEGIISYR